MCSKFQKRAGGAEGSSFNVEYQREPTSSTVDSRVMEAGDCPRTKAFEHGASDSDHHGPWTTVAAGRQPELDSIRRELRFSATLDGFRFRLADGVETIAVSLVLLLLRRRALPWP